MNIISKIAGAIKNARDSLKINWAEPPKRTTDLWVDMFHKSPMLDPVHMIATDVGSATFKVFDKLQHRKDPKRAEAYGENIIYDLLETPMPDHPEIDGNMFRYITEAYLELVGEAFWLIDRGARGRAVGLYIIPPTWMLMTPTESVPYFRVQPMGNTSHRYFDADPQDVVWFKAPNVYNPYGRGRGRSEAMGDEVETHEFASKYAKNFFYNDATPPIILEMPGITKPQADEFKENWMQRFGGILGAHKPSIVGQKDFKIHKLADSAKEMDFVEARKYLIQMANEHFCVPPEMRGNLQNSNRATIESAYYLWTKNVVSKRLRTLESTLNAQFVPKVFPGAKIVFDEIVPEDKEFKLKVLNDGLEKGVVMVNEWRMGNELPPDPVRGNVYLRGLMIQEVPANEKVTLPPAPPEPPKKALCDCVKDIEAATKTLKASAYTDEQKDLLWALFDKSARAMEPSFVKAVRKFSATQRKLVRAALPVVKTDADIESVLAGVFTEESAVALRRALAPAWLASMGVGKKNASAQLKKRKAAVDEEAYNALFNEWVNEAGLLKARQINDTTHKELQATLREELAASLAAGEGLAKMGARLLAACDGVYDGMDGARAELIARTESCSTVNFGTYATYKNEGVQRKEWLAIRDSRTRDSHGTEIEPVGIDEKFFVGGEYLDYPGDPNASAGQTCNCRCSMLAGLD